MADASSTRSWGDVRYFVPVELECFLNDHIYDKLCAAYGSDPTREFVDLRVKEFLTKYNLDKMRRSQCKRDMQTGKTKLIACWFGVCEEKLEGSIGWFCDVEWRKAFGDAQVGDPALILQFASHTGWAFSQGDLSEWINKFEEDFAHWDSVDRELRVAFDGMCVQWMTRFVVRAAGQFADELGSGPSSESHNEQEEKFQQAMSDSKKKFKRIYDWIDTEGLSRQVEHMVRIHFNATWPSLEQKVRRRAQEEEYTRNATVRLMYGKAQTYMEEFPLPTIGVLDQFLHEAYIEDLFT